MQSIQIAEFFARIGIKADVRQLEIFTQKMKELKVYTGQLKAALRGGAFKVNMDYSKLSAARKSLGQTTSEVKELRRAIAGLASQSTGIKLPRTMTIRNQSGEGRGGRGGGRLGFMNGGLAAGGLVRAGLAPVAATAVGIDMLNTSLKIDSARAALLSISETAAEGEQQFKWLRAEADRLGFVFLDNARNYTNFMAAGKAVGVEQSELQKIFSATAKYGRVLGLSTDDLSGTFRALQQMLSKGTVQSEELKGQLGERLPGAVGMAAKALGVTTKQLFKMLENGEVLADDLLPKLAKEFEKAAESNGAFALSMNMTGAKMALFKNKWNDLQDSIARSGALDAFINAMELLGTTLEIIAPLLRGIAKSIGFISELLEAVFNPAVMVTVVVVSLLLLRMMKLGLYLRAFAILWAITGAVALAAIAPWIALAAAITGVILLVEDLAVAAEGGDSQFKKWAEEGSTASQVMVSLAKGIREVINNTLEYWGLKDPRSKNTNGLGLVGAGAVFGDGGIISRDLMSIASGQDKHGMIPMMSAQQGYGMDSKVWNVTVAPTINVTAVGDKDETAATIKQMMMDEYAKTNIAFPGQ